MQNNDLKTPTDLTGNNKLSTNKINIKIQTYEDESIDCNDINVKEDYEIDENENLNEKLFKKSVHFDVYNNSNPTQTYNCQVLNTTNTELTKSVEWNNVIFIENEKINKDNNSNKRISNRKSSIGKKNKSTSLNSNSNKCNNNHFICFKTSKKKKMDSNKKQMSSLDDGDSNPKLEINGLNQRMQDTNYLIESNSKLKNCKNILRATTNKPNDMSINKNMLSNDTSQHDFASKHSLNETSPTVTNRFCSSFFRIFTQFRQNKNCCCL